MQKPQEEVMSEREWRVKHLPPKYAATWAVCEGERIITEGLTKRIAKEIADAHNAALGGEWEKFTYMLDEKESWLAAERQKLHETKEAEREAYSAYQEAAKQRDAERERRKLDERMEELSAACYHERQHDGNIGMNADHDCYCVRCCAVRVVNEHNKPREAI